MNGIETITLARLAIAFIPTLFVVAALANWSLDLRDSIVGLARMLVQLLLIGYFLEFIFETERGWVVMMVCAVMAMAASWIALRTSKFVAWSHYAKVLAAIAIGGGISLALVTQGVLAIDPWFAPRFAIPLAGMVFANAMNAVSLAAERYEAERGNRLSYEAARNSALRTALIPITNSLMAVGLVSIPGMMTGQVLAGVSPFIAARYQIMVMCMVFGAAGISAVIYLSLIRNEPAPPSRDV